MLKEFDRSVILLYTVSITVLLMIIIIILMFADKFQNKKLNW